MLKGYIFSNFWLAFKGSNLLPITKMKALLSVNLPCVPTQYSYTAIHNCIKNYKANVSAVACL